MEGMIYRESGRTLDKCYFEKVLWESVAIPSLLYGTEIILMVEKNIDELERIQARIGRWLLGGKRWSAKEAILGELGWMRIKDRIVRSRAEFYAHVMGMEERNKDRWVFKAMMEGKIRRLLLMRMRIISIWGLKFKCKEEFLESSGRIFFKKQD